MRAARAIRITRPGGPEVLEITNFSARDPGFGELAIEVAAAGLNRADLLQRRGLYPAPAGVATDVPGLEYAGTVAALGPGVSGFAVGDRVMGIVAGGGMATRVVVHAREAMRVPDNLSLVEAAAVPEAFVTAWDAMRQAGLRLGEVVLIHAVASGVGTAALQLASVAGARAIGTSRTAEKLERCRDLGLEHGIVAERGVFADEVRSLSGGRGADVILDSVGASYLDENWNALAMRGRHVLIGLMGGASVDAPLGKLLAKRATVIGTTLRGRPLEEKATAAQGFIREVLPHLASGRVRPVVGNTRPMTEIREAHAEMERNETFGKTVLSW
jgi:putative PIG3 family NAD(P)H quinone oxidoreductase